MVDKKRKYSRLCIIIIGISLFTSFLFILTSNFKDKVSIQENSNSSANLISSNLNPYDENDSIIFTEFRNFTSFNIESKENVAQFRFNYTELTNNEFISGAKVNASNNGIWYNFSTTDNLNVFWRYGEFNYSYYKAYIIEINTSYLFPRSKCKFSFEISKNTDLNDSLSWESQYFKLNVSTPRISIEAEVFLNTTSSEDFYNLDTWPGNQRYLYTGSLSFDYFVIYARLSAIIKGYKVYLTECHNISLNIYLFMYTEPYKDIYNTDPLSKIEMEYVDPSKNDTNLEGLWVCHFPLVFNNSDDFIGQEYQRNVNLTDISFIISLNITADNSFFKDKSSILIINPHSCCSDYFGGHMMTGYVGAVAVAMGGYGAKKALQLRIPYILRMTDESIEKIQKKKFPVLGVTIPRNDYLNQLVSDNYKKLISIKEKYTIQEKSKENSFLNNDSIIFSIAILFSMFLYLVVIFPYSLYFLIVNIVPYIIAIFLIALIRNKRVKSRYKITEWDLAILNSEAKSLTYRVDSNIKKTIALLTTIINREYGASKKISKFEHYWKIGYGRSTTILLIHYISSKSCEMMRVKIGGPKNEKFERDIEEIIRKISLISDSKIRKL